LHYEHLLLMLKLHVVNTSPLNPFYCLLKNINKKSIHQWQMLLLLFKKSN
jgi:hypothetical protein